MDRKDVLAYRIAAQQLDRPTAKRAVTDAAILDCGVQDTGRDGASWALVNRGVPLTGPADLIETDELVLVWTLRGAPHFYRRAEIVEVMTATSPYSEADAAKRVFGAAPPLAEAGIDTIAGLGVVARELRRITSRPTVKGEVSTRLSAALDLPYLRHCVPCQAVHSWEQPFRLGALYGGVELEPGTSPPVMRRIPGWPRRPAGPASDPLNAPAHLQPIRNYLRFLGPATAQEVASFVDAPVRDVKSHWPDDATQVTRDGKPAWVIDDPNATDADADAGLVRLLGPFDLLLQGRDRTVLVPDTTRHKALWPTIGRPGAVLAGTEIVALWRPTAKGSTFTLRLDPWARLTKALRGGIEDEAERLAAHRGLTLAAVESTD